MSTQPLLAGLDVGTTNIKALIFTPSGRVVAQASARTPTHYPQPGWAYYEPEEMWTTTAAVLREATAQVEAAHIASVAVASMGEAGVPLDAHNAPVYDAIAWFDKRTVPQAAWLAQTVGQERVFEIAGVALQSIFGLCKLLWLKENEPEVFARTVRWLNMADYIAFRLSGVHATDYSLASRTLALDLASLTWSDVMLQASGVRPDVYAPLCASGTRLGLVTAEAAAATGLPSSAQVAAGGHDHVCGAFAAGVIAPGMMLNSLGTSETVFVTLDKPLTDPQIGAQGYTQGAHVVSGLYYIFGSLFTSGASIEWFRRAIGANADYEPLIAEAAAAPVGSNGVVFLPHLQTASSPYNDAHARGAFIGLTGDSDRGALFRAVLEGLAFESRAITDTLREYPGAEAIREIVAVGGITRNTLLMTIKANVLGHRVTTAGIVDAAPLGAALLGGIGAGVFSGASEAQAALERDQHHYDPDPALVGRYDELYREVYTGTYRALRTLHHTIGRLQGEG